MPRDITFQSGYEYAPRYLVYGQDGRVATNLTLEPAQTPLVFAPRSTPTVSDQGNEHVDDEHVADEHVDDEHVDDDETAP